MSYLVLARKFRPQTFLSIAGQEHVTTALANSIARNRVPHALLFSGPRGVGKTTAARVFAKALNCQGRELPEDGTGAGSRQDVEPCGQCSNCEEIARSTSLAVWEIDGASNNSVDNIRELIESLHSAPPPGSRYKIYIIDEVHMLSTSAFNALLKTLEEPPRNTVFIFATTEPQKIPETVISRCQRYDFRRLPLEVISNALQEIALSEHIDVEKGVFEFIARRAQGGMRDAQSLFDRLIVFSAGKLDLQTAQGVFGVLGQSFYNSLTRHIFEENFDACITLLDEAFSQSLDIKAFLTDFLTHWRNLLVYSSASEKFKSGRSENLERILSLSRDEVKDLEALSKLGEEFDFQRLFELAEKIVETALRSNFPRFVIEAGIAKMSALPSLRPLAEIVSVLEKDSDPGTGGRLAASSAFVKKKAKISNVEGSKLEQNKKSPVGRSATESPLAARSAPRVTDSSQSQDQDPGQANVVERHNGDNSLKDVDVSEFNPSWEDFVSHVKSRSEPVLAAYLRRISAKHFVRGALEIEGTAFDINALKEQGTLMTLKKCLFSYSGYDNWDVKFAEADKGALSVEHVQEGSIVSSEIKREREREKQVEREVRADPITKDILSTFAGSRIEKISVLKCKP